MAFWSSVESKPMRNYRWQLTIEGFGAQDDVVWWAKTVTVPSFDVTEVEHDYFDNKYYFPGRVTWSDVEAVLVDPVNPSSVELTNTILEAAGYTIPSKKGAKETLSKSKSTTSGLGQVTLDLYDSEGAVVESWSLQNAFIKAAKFGDMDYSNDELRQVSLTLKYDWATCTIKQGDAFFTKRDPGT
jgi:hypothetical protein